MRSATLTVDRRRISILTTIPAARLEPNTLTGEQGLELAKAAAGGARDFAIRWIGHMRSRPGDRKSSPMQTYDFTQTAELLGEIRTSQMFIPVLLGVFCGVRRGEICALRWRHVDLVNGQLSVAGSVEQTKGGKKGLRFKTPKSGKGRTVALSATVVEELRA